MEGVWKIFKSKPIIEIVVLMRKTMILEVENMIEPTYLDAFSLFINNWLYFITNSGGIS